MTTSTDTQPRLKLEQYLGIQIKRQRQAQELKIADVARIAGLHEENLRTLIKRGKLRDVRRRAPGGQRQWSEKEVEAALAKLGVDAESAQGHGFDAQARKSMNE